MKSCDLILLDGSVGDLVKQRLATLSPANANAVGVQVAYKDGFSNASYATLGCPDIVQALHRAYVDAGCDVLTTNSFGCSMHCLRKAHIEEYRDEMVIQSRILAQREAKKKGVLVAGSLPPLSGEDCYLPNRSMTEEMQEAMRTEYEDLVRLLCPRDCEESPVDILLCETMATSTEAICAAQACIRVGSSCPRVWVSFTLDDTLDFHGSSCRLRGRESLEDAVKALLNAVNVEAVLVNCCSWVVASAACKALKRILIGDMGHIRYGAYANGFITTTREWLMKEYDGVDEVEESRVLVSHGSKNDGGVVSEKEYAEHVMDWISHGATIVGGCCGIGPSHITEMKERMKKRGFSIQGDDGELLEGR